MYLQACKSQNCYPQIWADQLNLSKLGRADYAHHKLAPLDFKNFRQPWNSSPAYNETAETAVQDNCFYFFLRTY